MSTKPAAIKSAFNTLQGKLREGEIPVWVDPFLILTNSRVFHMTGFTGNKVEWDIEIENITAIEHSTAKKEAGIKFNLSDGSTKLAPHRSRAQFEDFNSVYEQVRSGSLSTAEESAAAAISAHKSDKFGAATNWSKDLPGWLYRTIEENRLDNEPVEVIILGDVAYAGALVGFSDRCMILKGGAIGGFMSNSFGGGRSTTFYYKQITGIEFNGGLINGVLEILTPSYQGTANKDFWKGINSGFKPNKDSNDPWTLSNTLPMSKATFNQSKSLIDHLRKKIANAHNPTVIVNQQSSSDLASQIRNLSELHEQGVLSAEEFQQAKARLLG